MTSAVPIPLMYALVTALLCAMVGQVVHAYVRSMHSSPSARPLVAVYECALIAHLALMSICSLSLLRALADPSLDADMALLWGNAGVACCVVAMAVVNPDDAGGPPSAEWMLPAEAVLVLLSLPCVFACLPYAQMPVFVIDALYFTVRGAYLLYCDGRNRRAIVSPLSVAEALRLLPEGILYADREGRITLKNDVMRRCLDALGLGPLARVDDVWRALEQRAREGVEREGAEVLSLPSRPSVIARVAPDEARLFVGYEGIGEGGVPARTEASEGLSFLSPARRNAKAAARSLAIPCIVAYDVTEAAEVLEGIEQVNRELEASQVELRASAETARTVAENEALLRMRARVHDIIGQRLSLLHRALEDDDLSDEKIEQLKPYLLGILEDLSVDAEVSPHDELEATINAFAHIGVQVMVSGSLPENERHAKLLADCVREAATNAVKHGHAGAVTVQFGVDKSTIRNDGQPPLGPVNEGTGLSAMRSAIEAEGGTLDIAQDPFTLTIRL